MTERKIGLWGAEHSLEPTSATDPGGDEREIYTMPQGCRKVWVQNLSGSGITMKVLWNDDGATGGTASDTLFNICLEAGDTIESPEKLLIHTIGVYFSGAATWGIDYIISGWN